MTEQINAKEAFDLAWRRLAPCAPRDLPAPTGFWPDVARVAVAIALSGDPDVPLDFSPHTFQLIPTTSIKETRAANTAALLAKLSAGKI